eukprot:4520881-Pyramimonas_sp.AAC.1
MTSRHTTSPNRRAGQPERVHSAGAMCVTAEPRLMSTLRKWPSVPRPGQIYAGITATFPLLRRAVIGAKPRQRSGLPLSLAEPLNRRGRCVLADCGELADRRSALSNGRATSAGRLSTVRVE